MIKVLDIVFENKALKVLSKGTVIDKTAAQVFEIMQTEEFSSDQKISARPAELGLRITTSPPWAQIDLMARPRHGSWMTVSIEDDWVHDEAQIAYMSPYAKHQVLEFLDTYGAPFGKIGFSKAARLAVGAGDELFIEVLESASSPASSGDAQASELGTHSLKVPLHDYQQWSVNKLTEFCRSGLGAVLADEMGLGKTVQAIAVVINMINQGGKALVVVPSVLIPNWRREFTKFAPTLRVGVHHRPSGQEVYPDDYPELDVVITSYSALASKYGDAHLINKERWSIAVIDESQFIKNPDAKRSEATKLINRASSLALSGTPVENSPLDVWSLAEFIFPNLLGDREEFDTDIFLTDLALHRVRSFFRPLMIRRTLDDIASMHPLPDRIEEVEYLDMGRERRLEQQQVLSASVTPQSRFNSLVMLAAESHSDQDEPTFKSSAKYRRLRMLIQNAIQSGEKLIVFCNYKTAMNFLRDSIRNEFPNIYCDVIRGDSGSPEERQKIVDDFSAAQYGVLILNPVAAGFGLNITAANNVVHFHPQWNPAKTDQATKRAHRPGQTRVTKVHHLIYESSVEEVIAKRSNTKRELASNLLGGEPVVVEMPSLDKLFAEVKRLNG